MAFFYVRNNHVVLITSPVLTERRVDEYFNWILSLASGSAPLVSLLDTPPPSGRARGLLQDVKRVSIDPTPLMQDQSDGSFGTKLRGSILRDFMARLKEVGGRGVDTASIDRALASENVRASIEIRYSGRMPPEGVPLLDELARLVADVADEGYKIDVKGRGQLTPGDFRIRDRRSIRAQDGHPHISHAISTMSDWLDSLIENGAVVD
jgi:hypothetical protein